jgi:hypothetical protein
MLEETTCCCGGATMHEEHGETMHEHEHEEENEGPWWAMVMVQKETCCQA